MSKAIRLLKRGRSLLQNETTCTIKRAGGTVAASTTPTAVHNDLPCSHVYEMSAEEAEKAGMATITRPMSTFAKLPDSGVIKEEDIAVVNSKEYTIRKAVLWPHDDPSHYLLIMEFRR